MALDPKRKNPAIADAYDMEMRAEPNDLVVYMNSEDLKAARVAVGGLEIGMFAGIRNTTIVDWEAAGVSFVGVPFMLPGTFLILHKSALSIVVYFNETYQESYKFHLVDNYIKHAMLKVVGFRNFPGHFGAMDKFQPDPI